MNITFKQGIIKYPVTGSQQSFLQKNGTDVNLLADNGSTLVNFTHGDSNYIFEEFLTISNAWIGPFNSGTEYWLYWDIDTITGERTFGHTVLAPLISSNKPSNPTTGQHWFDLVNNKMFVFETSIWRNVIRVFATYYDGLDFYSMGIGVGDFPYAGSQVGITNINNVAGKILFNNDKPVLKPTREFFTTESIFNVNGSNIDSLRLESSYNIVKANETIPKYHVVSYISEDLVQLADYDDTTGIIGLMTEDANINETANVILDGIISNPAWNFTQPVGSHLWVSENGELVNNDPHNTDNITNPVQYPPVAKILSSNSILFQQFSEISGSNSTVTTNNTPATTTEIGIVKLSTTPTDNLEPIVASDTDPRLSDDRTPLPHVHDSEDVTFNSNTGLLSINVENGLDELNTNKANLSGSTFTGNIQLPNNPVSDLHAVTKQYVDNLVSGLSWIDPIHFTNVIGDTILTNPTSPTISDTYIIPSIGSPSGDWTGFLNNDIVQWDGDQWNILDNLSTTLDTRFGISFTSQSTPFGSFIGQAESIATYSGGNWTFESPVNNNATLVNSENDYHSYHQFVYDTKWIQFTGPNTILPGLNISRSGNTLSVQNVADGGTIDALTLDSHDADEFLLNAGDIMVGDGTGSVGKTDGVLKFNHGLNPEFLSFGENQGDITVASHIRSTNDFLMSTDDQFHIHYNSAGINNGFFRISNGEHHTGGSSTPVFTIEETGTIKSNISNYETLVVDDNDIPNKKYVDDNSGGSGGGSPYNFTTVTPIIPSTFNPSFTLVSLSPVNEYYTHVMDNITDLFIEPPRNIPGQRDRIVLMLEQPSSFAYSIVNQNSNIIWKDAEAPPTEIGNSNSSFEVIEYEFWEHPVIPNYWLGHYKLYSENTGAEA